MKIFCYLNWRLCNSSLQLEQFPEELLDHVFLSQRPKLIKTLNGMNVELVACEEYHTCAVTISRYMVFIILVCLDMELE